MPRFSIIIPFLDAAETLSATLESLWSQTCKDFEVICVSDGADDASKAIVTRAAAADPRISLHENPGRGPSDARNYGASIARGEFLSFCDADDLWTARKLADLDARFREEPVQALYGQIAFFEDQPRAGTTRSEVPEQSLTISDLLGENPVCTLSNLTVSADAFRQCGGFDRRMVHNEDLEFLIRFVGSGNRIDGINRQHVWYRTSRNGLSSNLAAMQAGRRQAVACARRFGVSVTPEQEAVYLRYLARRTLRLGSDPREAARFARQGLTQHAPAFLHPLRRGGLTALASFAAPFLPRRLRHSLFSK